MSDPAIPGDESFCYVTTTGRVTGKLHTIEIWFAWRGAALYLLAGGRRRSDWVKNIIADAHVGVTIADRTFEGDARIVHDPDEEAWARRALLEKYRNGYAGDLTNWSRTALPVAIDLV